MIFLALAAVSALFIWNELGDGVSRAIAQQADPLPDRAAMEAECRDGDDGRPWFVTVCYPLIAYTGGGAGPGGGPVVFRDTPDDSPQYPLTANADIGSSWGLAYAAPQHALYVAAFQKRGVPYAGNSSEIRRIQLDDGSIRTVIRVAGGGGGAHGSPVGGQDEQGRDLVGKVGLGDIDVNEMHDELFVVGLEDRRIYRYRLADHQPLGSFDHGAIGEPWREEARPFGLGVYRGRIYHGLVRSAEQTRDPQDLTGSVYSSWPDGTDMRLEARWPLTDPRGVARIPSTVNVPEPIVDVPLSWNPWTDGDPTLRDGEVQTALHPQPIVADIEFGSSGELIVGMRDRRGDMGIGAQYDAGSRIIKPALGLGDLLLGLPLPGGNGWNVRVVPETFYDRTSLADESAAGGLARWPHRNQVVAGALFSSDPSNPSPVALIGGAVWYAVADDSLGAAGQRRGVEGVCSASTIRRAVFALAEGNGMHRAGDTSISTSVDVEVVPGGAGGRLPGVVRRGRDPVTRRPPRAAAPHAPDHSEYLPARTIGDVEVLCGPAPEEPPSSPTPTPTPTASATASATLTPSSTPTATPTPGPIFLPVTVDDRCSPTVRRTAVVLILDASTSMLEETRAGRAKMSALIDAAGRFLDRLSFPGDRAGIVTFNAEAVVLSPMTSDEVALRAALTSVENRELTRIHLGIDEARDMLAATRRDADVTPAIVLLTDGRSNPDPIVLAIEAADRAKDEGAVIFTIGLGEDVQRTALRRMASRPEYFRWAPDGEDLVEIYERIAGEIPCPASAFWPYPEDARR